MSTDKQKPGVVDNSRLADKSKASTPIVTRKLYVSGNARLYTLTEAGRAAVRAALAEQEAADEHA